MNSSQSGQNTLCGTQRYRAHLAVVVCRVMGDAETKADPFEINQIIPFVKDLLALLLLFIKNNIPSAKYILNALDIY